MCILQDLFCVLKKGIVGNDIHVHKQSYPCTLGLFIILQGIQEGQSRQYTRSNALLGPG